MPLSSEFIIFVTSCVHLSKDLILWRNLAGSSRGYVINYQPLVMLFLTPISYIGSLLVSVLITSVLRRLSGPLVHPLHSKIWSLRPKAMRSLSVNFSLITVLLWRLWLSPPVPLVVVDVETIVVTATIEEAETTVVVVEIMVFVIITGTPMVLVIRVNCVASMVMSLVRVLPMCRIPPVKPILQTRFRRNVKLIPTMLVGMLTPGLPIIRLNLLDRETRQVLAQGRCENGLYVLNQDHQALSAVSINKASYELWHSRLGHVSNDVIKLLNKTGLVQVTSILPKPIVCSSCQMSKAQKLPFDLNPKRALFPLDLVHCDLWRPSPITSHEGYRYYVAFVDDFSRFTWLYPLHTKAMFSTILTTFITFVQTQFSRKIKVFQSDGGTEFVNNQVKKIFQDNGTFHRLSCPYIPQQNGRVERKHRHIIETGLAMMFNAKVPSSYWVEAFSSAVLSQTQHLQTRILLRRSNILLLVVFV
ncbi:uncharacterized protein LOC110912566 isoform X6 [Helianthus annuus]|uniref:uncharacterized protein LOC110912566 isoform X6 n=1 Tax=Helianthus annuus TaxID=4232 RepID=UPI00165330CB|nr:uncharacterized protein LOC110912566 isoform X6 [Helianthus annuus]